MRQQGSSSSRAASPSPVDMATKIAAIVTIVTEVIMAITTISDNNNNNNNK